MAVGRFRGKQMVTMQTSTWESDSMKLRSKVLVFGLAVCWAAIEGSIPAYSQEAAPGPKEIVLERVPLRIKSPDEYQMRFQLRSTRELTIAAPAGGAVQLVPVQAGQPVRAQSELVRLNSEERLLERKIASAEYEAAQAAHNAASGAQKEIEAARLNAAKARLELAEFRLKLLVVLAPIDGEVRDRDGGAVSVGSFVHPGETLLRLIDPRELYVEIPVERDKVKPGDTLSLAVEAKTASGKVQAVVEATGAFQKLQDLFVSVAVAKVVIDNSQGAFKPGQAVLPEMIPRMPIAEVPTQSLKNSGDSQTERMVQIIREGFIRNLPIQPLGQVGPGHVYVSARFAPGDELIVSSSEPVADGAWVRSLLDVPGLPASGGGGTDSKGTGTPSTPGGTPSPSGPKRSTF